MVQIWAKSEFSAHQQFVGLAWNDPLYRVIPLYRQALGQNGQSYPGRVLVCIYFSSHSYFCLQCLMFIMLTYASILSLFSISCWSLLSSSFQCSSLPSSALIFTFIRGTNKFLYTFLGVHRLQNDLVPRLSASWVK